MRQHSGKLLLQRRRKKEAIAQCHVTVPRTLFQARSWQRWWVVGYTCPSLAVGAGRMAVHIPRPFLRFFVLVQSQMRGSRSLTISRYVSRRSWRVGTGMGRFVAQPATVNQDASIRIVGTAHQCRPLQDAGSSSGRAHSRRRSGALAPATVTKW